MIILRRYIFREVLVNFLASLLVFTGILFTVQVLRTSELIISKGVAGEQVLRVFGAIIPTFLELALPLATLMGVMFAFARLSGDSEIIVLRSSGISLHQLIQSLLSFSLLALGFAIFVSFLAKPWGYRTLSETLFEIAQTKTAASLDSGIFTELGPVTVYAEHVNHRSGVLDKVLIHDRRNTQESQVIFSENGRIISKAGEQEIQMILSQGVAHELGNGAYSVTDFTTNRLILSSADLYAEGREGLRRPRELSTSNLRTELQQRESGELTTMPNSQIAIIASDNTNAQSDTEILEMLNKDRIKDLQIELEQRYATPFATLIFVFLAMPLGIHPPRAQRTWGIGLSVATALIVFLIYFGVLSVGLALAQSETLSPRLAVWIPNIIALLATVYCVKQMSSERWASIGQAFGGMLGRILRPFNLVVRSR